MTEHLHPSILSNPMLLMADLGLRALDLTVSSSHQLRDGVDRYTRAAASRQPAQQGARWIFAATDSSAAPAPAATSSNAATLDPLTRGWVQWMATMGAVASLGAGRGFGAPAAGETIPVAVEEAGRRHTGDVERGAAEHALAVGERRQRRGGGRPKSQ